MGLDIRSSIKSDRFGSYGYLHVLRKWVYVNIEGFSQKEVNGMYDHSGKAVSLDASVCTQLLEHSDCNGGYIDGSSFGIGDSFGDPEMMYGNSTELAEELIMLAEKHYDNMPEEVQECFDHFWSFVFEDTKDEVIKQYRYEGDVHGTGYARVIRFT